ncbi:MAG: hypothetical protein ACLVB5_06210 [Christensenellales bacterium]
MKKDGRKSHAVDHGPEKDGKRKFRHEHDGRKDGRTAFWRLKTTFSSPAARSPGKK